MRFLPRFVVCATLVALSLAFSIQAQLYTFRNYAGTRGGPGTTDGLPSEARFWRPSGMATDASQNVYVADSTNHTIRKVTPAGIVTTVAGLATVTGTAAGFGHAARFNRPTGVALDSVGNIYVADSNNHAVRKISPAGLVTNFAGMPGTSGHTNGQGTAARFFLIFGIATDTNDNVYVSEYGTHTIRKITPGGLVSTIAGSPDLDGFTDGTGSNARFDRPLGLTVDADFNVYVADWNNQLIRKITPAGVVTTIGGGPDVCGYTDGAAGSSLFCSPRGVVVDAAGDVYVADGSNHRVRRISGGIVSTFAGSGASTSVDGNGTAASFFGVQDIAIDAADNLYVSEVLGHTIRKITPAQDVTTLTGAASVTGFDVSSGPAARFALPDEVAIASDGSVFIADAGNAVIRKIPVGSLQPVVFAGSPGVTGSADGDAATARFKRPVGLGIDTSDNLYVSDYFDHTIRKVTPAGVVSTLAGSPGLNGSDNGTGNLARFNAPGDVAVDASGNVYVADTFNHTIRKVTPAGVVTTLAGMAGFNGSENGTGSAARFYQPTALVVASDGNLYVADLANQLVRKVTMAGVVTTLAGSPGQIGGVDGSGASARFFEPRGIAADGSGNLFVADGRYTVRKVTLAGAVTTIAGRFEIEGSEDGTGTVARFSNLQGIASTSGGVLFLTDQNTLKRGAPAIADSATIDVAEGAVGATRQLGTTLPITATLWNWSIVRRPRGSTAALSSTTSRTPAFTPDVPDRYTFRLLAAAGSPNSITEVDLVAVGASTLTVGPSTLPAGASNIIYSALMTATGGAAPYHFEVMSGALPAGFTLSPEGVVSGLAQGSGTFVFSVRATDSVGATGVASISLTIHPTAGAMVASATSPTAVALSWPSVAGAAGYRIQRSEAGTSFSQIAQVGTTSHIDATVLANKAYLYRVVVYDSANRQSAPGAQDLATTVIFTDPSLAGGVPVRASHVTQLRTAVNAVRSLAFYGGFVFTDATLAGLPIRVEHVQELRSALAAPRNSLGLPALTFTDATLTAGDTIIKAIHVTQLRGGVQ